MLLKGYLYLNLKTKLKKLKLMETFNKWDTSQPISCQI